jgi:hypothetical protein
VRKSSGIGPAQAAARDLAAAQVDAFEPRGIDEYFEHRLRLWQSGHLGRVELERDEVLAPTGDVAAPEIRARRGHHQRQVLPQYPVLRQIVDLRSAASIARTSSALLAPAPAPSSGRIAS